MRIFSAIAASALTIFFVGCGSGEGLQSADSGDVPSWYTNVPQDPNYIYAANSQVSQDMQAAIDKATMAARANIGRQVDIRVQALQKKFSEETGTGDDEQLLQIFSQVEKTVVSASINGSKLKYHKEFKAGAFWRAYILVEYPIGATAQTLTDQIKKNDQMYTRFKASQTFKELNEEVNKYEDSMNQKRK